LGQLVREPVTIAQWSVPINGDQREGWHLVTFADGGQLCVHQSRFEEISE